MEEEGGRPNRCAPPPVPSTDLVLHRAALERMPNGKLTGVRGPDPGAPA